MADETQTADTAPKGEASSGPAATTSAITARPSFDAVGDEGAADDWSPPKSLPNGTAVDADGLPINLRLRALTLADQGKDSDPSGPLEPEAIAAARDSLAAFDAHYSPISSSTKTAELEKIAASESVDISGASTNEDRASLILAARPARII